MSSSRLAFVVVLALASLACDLNKDVTKQCRQAATDAQCTTCCKDNGSSYSHFGGAMGTCTCER